MDRAKAILAELEKGERQAPVDKLLGELPLFAALPVIRQEPPSAKAQRTDALREALEAVNPDEMTPREALEALYRLKSLG